MSTVIVYRSKSASFAAKRVADAAEGLRAVQQDAFRHQPGDTALVRWDCYDELNARISDINPASAVQSARDKIRARQALGDLAPVTWSVHGTVTPHLPCVIRPRRHRAGAHFYVCRTQEEVQQAVRRLRRMGWYGSELINKAREFRVFVVGGRVATVSERLPGAPNDIAWNIAMGGRLINVNRADWPVPVCKAGIEACRRLGLGWGAVDVCIDQRGRVYVFEINTSPALKNKFTIKKIAEALASPFVEGEIREGARKPRSYAHPATLSDRERSARPAAAPEAAVAAVPASPEPVNTPAPQRASQESVPMPAIATSVITTPIGTDQVTITAGEAKANFIRRAEEVFERAFQRERLHRRANIERQIAELRQRLESDNY